MKYFLLLLSALIFGNVFSQQSYIIPRNAELYELPQGGFLSLNLLNNKTHIKQYDVSGSIVWEDSLAFQLPLDSVRFNWISRFKNSDQYIISMNRSISQDEIIFNNENDTVIYQFTKLNLQTHQFESQRLDTIISRYIYPLEFNDTSIYLYASFVDPAYAPLISHNTLSINSDLELSLVAPYDSAGVVNGYYFRYYKFDDTIYQHSYIRDLHFMNSYTQDMSLKSNHYRELSSDPLDNVPLYEDALNKDSLFMFTQRTSNEFETGRECGMKWVKYDLSTINSTEFLLPPHEITDYFKVATDRIKKRIVVLTNAGNLYFYDYNFALKCMLSLGSEASSGKLTELNGRIYLQMEEGDYDELSLLECDEPGFTTGITYTDIDVIDIFPNPSSDFVNIRNDQSRLLSVKLFSTDGKIMKILKSEEELIRMDISSLEAGIYLISVEYENHVQIGRIVKE